MNNYKIKILILTSRGGHGLISGSHAIKEAFEDAGIHDRYQSKIIDLFEKTSPIGNALTSLYNLLLRRSIWLNSIYLKIIHHFRLDKLRLLHSLSYQSFIKLIHKENPEILIMTSEYLIDFVAYSLNRASLNHIATYICNIDIGTSVIPLWFHKSVDLHILPTKESEQEYLRQGFDPEKGVLAALTVRRRFIQFKEKRHDVLKKLGLDPEKFTILLTGSREGNFNMLKIAYCLDSMKENIQLIAVCGTNKKLFEKMALFNKRSQKEILVIGWAENMQELMNAADVAISKAGKQTIKETIFMNLPMIVTAFPAVMEQEAGNIEFLLKRSLNLIAKSLAEIPPLVQRLIYDQDHKKKLLYNLKETARQIRPDIVVKNVVEHFEATKGKLLK